MNRKQFAIFLAAPIVGSLALGARWAEIPARVATHWGLSGEADGYTSKGVALVLVTIVMPLAIASLLTLILLAVPRESPFLQPIRTLPVGLIWFITGLTVGSTISQTATSTGNIGTALAIGLVGGAAMWWAAWAVRSPAQPLPPRTDAMPIEAPRLAGASRDQRLWWTGQVTSTMGSFALGVTVIATIVAIVGLFTAPASVTITALIVAGTFVLVAAMMAFDVTIGEREVLIASRLRWPRLRVPLDSIDHAGTTTVKALRWGGWGIRSASGRTGVIVRSGEALQIERTDGHVIVVTIDGAQEAAATINTLIERDDAAAR